MHVAPSPCNSCPYRRDTPPGVWDAVEYEKLRCYDDGPTGQTAYGTFLCHQSISAPADTICRGWLSVHCESVAVRLASLNGRVTAEQVYAPVSVDLYATGNEAADAGEAGIEDMSEDAFRVVVRLLAKKATRIRPTPPADLSH